MQITFKKIIILSAFIFSISACSLKAPELPSASDSNKSKLKAALSGEKTLNKCIDEKKDLEFGVAEFYLKSSKNPEEIKQAFEWYLRSAECGNPHSQYRIAQMYRQGIGVEKSLILSSQWLRMAATEKVPGAEKELGEFYRDGLAFEKDNEKAIYWFERAAKSGDIPAIMALGEMYKGWFGMQPDYTKSLAWYKKAASLGSTQAEFEIAWLISRGAESKQENIDFKKAEKLFFQSAKNGNPDAYAELGDLYYEGRSGVRDLRLAREYYLKAASLNSSLGYFRLGMLSLEGKNIDYAKLCCCPKNKLNSDYPAAFKYFKQAAENGLVMAQYQVGIMYLNGHGTNQDLKKGMYWLEKASQQNFPLAQVKLADLYLAGNIYLPKRPDKAAFLYDKAANKNNTYALYMLSVMYRLGFGLPKNFVTSVKLAEKAQKNNNAAFAQYEIAKKFQIGDGFAKNLFEAERWYKLAAGYGLASAQAALGDLYLSTDFESYMRQQFKTAEEYELGAYQLAYSYYRLAAAQGLSYGEYNAAFLLAKGQGVEKNPKLAVALLKRAARRGFKPAQVELGWKYFLADGIKQDYARAYAWWQVALDDKFDTDPEFIEYLTNNMQPDISSLAIRYAKRFKKKYTNYS